MADTKVIAPINKTKHHKTGGSKMKVRVVEQGGIFKEVNVGDDATVAECIRAAGVDTSRSKEIRVNTEPAEKEDIVHAGDVIHVIPNIEGGR